jgi:hypothetical protein
MVIDNDFAFVEHLRSVRTHPMQNKRARSDARMNEISITVIVPEGTWVFVSRPSEYGNWSRPWPLCRGSGAHEDALFRCGKKHVVAPIVKSDRRRPGSLCIAIAALHVVSSVDVESRKYVSYDVPVHQVMRFKYRNAGHEVEARSYQVITLPNPNYIWIGVVRKKNRIAVVPIILIASSSP